MAGALKRQADWGETLSTKRGTFKCCAPPREQWKAITTGPYDPTATCVFTVLKTDFDRSDLGVMKDRQPTQFQSGGFGWTVIRCMVSSIEPEVEITATLTK
tara:strand:- start:883 stop:1185 length:303 start_codon:yes stop_codon:yes gene_type:complete